jgi:hypothetical protein
MIFNYLVVAWCLQDQHRCYEIESVVGLSKIQQLFEKGDTSGLVSSAHFTVISIDPRAELQGGYRDNFKQFFLPEFRQPGMIIFIEGLGLYQVDNQGKLNQIKTIAQIKEDPTSIDLILVGMKVPANIFPDRKVSYISV